MSHHEAAANILGSIADDDRVAHIMDLLTGAYHRVRLIDALLQNSASRATARFEEMSSTERCGWRKQSRFFVASVQRSHEQRYCTAFNNRVHGMTITVWITGVDFDLYTVVYTCSNEVHGA